VASWPTNPDLIGKSTRRIDGPDKAQGKAKYTYDLTRPNMLYGRIIRSPHPHARVVAIDFAEALKAPGV
jgi:CO/xanthine dehydrogenase Mo-binding subunit